MWFIVLINAEAEMCSYQCLLHDCYINLRFQQTAAQLIGQWTESLGSVVLWVVIWWHLELCPSHCTQHWRTLHSDALQPALCRPGIGITGVWSLVMVCDIERKVSPSSPLMATTIHSSDLTGVILVVSVFMCHIGHWAKANVCPDFALSRNYW